MSPTDPFVRVGTDLILLSEVRRIRRVGDGVLAVWFRGQEPPELLRGRDMRNFADDFSGTVGSSLDKLPIGPMPTGFGLSSRRITLTMKAMPAAVPAGPPDDEDDLQDADGTTCRWTWATAILDDFREVATHEQVRVARDILQHDRRGTFRAPLPLLRDLARALDTPSPIDAYTARVDDEMVTADDLNFADQVMELMADVPA